MFIKIVYFFFYMYIQVIGLIKIGNDVKILMVLFVLDSSVRFFLFEFKLIVNEQKKKMDFDMVIFLRVYIEDVLTDKIFVIGSCFVLVFKVKLDRLSINGIDIRIMNYVYVQLIIIFVVLIVI